MLKYIEKELSKEIVESHIKEHITELFDIVKKDYTSFFNYDTDFKLEFIRNVDCLARIKLEEKIIQFNLDKLSFSDIRTTIVHEITHYICYENYLYDNSIYDHADAHNLEFCIILNCTLRKFGYSKKNFLRSYDLHEDVVYNKIDINLSSFDKLINSTNFQTLDQLIEKAKTYAQRIRNKYDY